MFEMKISWTLFTNRVLDLFRLSLLVTKLSKKASDVGAEMVVSVTDWRWNVWGNGTFMSVTAP